MLLAGILLVVALLAVAGLAVGVKLEHDKVQNAAHPTPGESMCTTAECVKLSSEILSRLDETHDPCEDFYKFACNTYDSTTIIPHGK